MGEWEHDPSRPYLVKEWWDDEGRHQRLLSPDIANALEQRAALADEAFSDEGGLATPWVITEEGEDYCIHCGELAEWAGEKYVAEHKPKCRKARYDALTAKPEGGQG